MNDDDDRDLLRAWRDAGQEGPGELLDRRILAAARAQQTRRRTLPLAAALAACLVLALYAERSRTVTTPPAKPDMSMAGLYEGRSADLLADPEAMQQMMIRNMPGGSSTSPEIPS